MRRASRIAGTLTLLAATFLLVACTGPNEALFFGPATWDSATWDATRWE